MGQRYDGYYAELMQELQSTKCKTKKDEEKRFRLITTCEVLHRMYTYFWELDDVIKSKQRKFFGFVGIGRLIDYQKEVLDLIGDIHQKEGI